MFYKDHQVSGNTSLDCLWIKLLYIVIEKQESTHNAS